MPDVHPTKDNNSKKAGGGSAMTGMAIMRIGLGAMFLYVFVENFGKGLYGKDGYTSLINYYIEKGHAPAVWKNIMSLAASHATVAGPMQAATEISFGVLLLIGLLTRPIALAAFLFLASLWISEWGTAWIWELLIPMIAAFSLMVGGAGRKWGIDAKLARRYPRIPLW
jgi:uncharacterized membrane protein YphA (DoxX/SURF4 family)